MYVFLTDSEFIYSFKHFMYYSISCDQIEKNKFTEHRF